MKKDREVPQWTAVELHLLTYFLNYAIMYPGKTENSANWAVMPLLYNVKEVVTMRRYIIRIILFVIVFLIVFTEKVK